MRQRIWDYKLECWRDEDVLADGEMLRVPLMLCDGAQRDVRDHFARDHFVRDALARHNATGLHRPGFCIDALVHAPQPTVSVSDADADLLERRGTTVRAVFADRERALNEVERRQQWRTVLDARTKVEPPDDDDEDDNDDEPNGELVGSAEYGSEGDHEYQPDDDNGDDDENDVFKAPREYKQKGQYGSGEYGHSGGAPDASGLRAPQDDRERARIERDRRGDQAWRTGRSVSRADANQRQLERWRGK